MTKDIADAIGVLEFDSVPKGMKVLNQVAKNIEFSDIKQKIISGRRYIGILYGKHASLEYAMNYAIDNSDGALVEIGWIGSPHRQLLEFLNKELTVDIGNINNIFVVELLSHARLLELTNYILHHTPVDLVDIDSKEYLDGASIAIFRGKIDALQLAKHIIPEGEMITNLDPVIRRGIISGR
ncbi:hypothetical protein [Paramaledivibacter caminithermalis]|jgi:microcompartment protein CcmL/EutN|uniref:BMC domain-containing protein n=1 Tax=Paramaledivibacter caminithermalis (strain DSM 15212 / CIP 107654 / DViRD3) TaxID=1121301 RepID=A0A1M6P4J2_PARC5|nr:hypothetical protein [Paramaledivibacter caminithermalis]SHK02822.1 hypothetical protein SAMN02745912_02013 [Paramaledivibacter caminithermalis DSM 15212]